MSQNRYIVKAHLIKYAELKAVKREKTNPDSTKDPDYYRVPKFVVVREAGSIEKLPKEARMDVQVIKMPGLESHLRNTSLASLPELEIPNGIEAYSVRKRRILWRVYEQITFYIFLKPLLSEAKETYRKAA